MKEPLDGLSVAAPFLAMSVGPSLRASSAHSDQAPLPAALASFLTDEAHGSASDRDLLLAGEPVVKLLDADPDREVAVFGAVWVDAPPTLDDFAAMEMSDKDFDDLKTCKIGDCLVKLDAEAIATLRAEVDWGKPTAKADATAVFRRLALRYVNAYREGGNARLAVYRDESRPAFAASEFRSMIDRLPRLAGEWPDLQRYLPGYPAASPAESVGIPVLAGGPVRPEADDSHQPSGRPRAAGPDGRASPGSRVAPFAAGCGPRPRTECVPRSRV